MSTRDNGILLLSGDRDGPVFSAPWHAQIFALAHSLSDRGLFTWSEWTDCFSRHLASHGDTPGEEGYYEAWLSALEEMASAKGAVAAAELSGRKDDWARAARVTPHGQPITLR